MKNIYISNDHTAVDMKNAIKKHLIEQKYNVIDLGNTDKTSCNYAANGKVLGQAVINDPNSFGIALCGTGVGISIAANKVKGIRAGLVYEIQTAKLIRQHNDANILSTGARLIAIEKAIELVDAFLQTEFEGGRHQERVDALNE